MKARALCTVPLLLLFTSIVSADQRPETQSLERKQAWAVRVADGAIRLDGRLSEDAWREAIAITDFIQKEPLEGAPPTEMTEVRILYNSDALYIGARMYKHAGSVTQAPMGRRDDVEG